MPEGLTRCTRKASAVCTRAETRRPRKTLKIKNLSGPEFFGVANGTRTHDNQNHNLGLYQLSYSHHRSQ